MSIRCDESSRSSLSRKLRLIVREEGKGDNLFVRLPSSIAFDLHSLARRQPQNELSAAYPRKSGDAWNIFDEEPNACVSFLPLCISVGDNITIFASYNGGACVSSSEKGMYKFQCDITFNCDKIYFEKKTVDERFSFN
jgi:hypothetical protein